MLNKGPILKDGPLHSNAERYLDAKSHITHNNPTNSFFISGEMQPIFTYISSESFIQSI